MLFVAKVHNCGYLFYNEEKGHSLVHTVAFDPTYFDYRTGIEHTEKNIPRVNDEQKKKIAELEFIDVKTSTGRCSITRAPFCQFPDDLLQKIFVQFFQSLSF